MRRAVLAVLLTLAPPWVLVPGAQAQEVPGGYLPNEAAIPDGYELQGELLTRDGWGETVEKWYVHDETESDLRVIAVAARSEAVAQSVCDMAAERLRGDDFVVQPAEVGGMPGVVAERRMGLSYERAAFVTSGSACLGVRIAGQEDRLPEPSAAPILHAMVTKGRAA